jgi:transposase
VEVAFSDSSPTGGSDEFPYEITLAPQRCLRLGRHDELERVQEILHQDPLSGHLFVFVNRRGDRVKILFWDRSGFALFYKRLEEGVFHLPPEDVGGVEIDVPRLTLILEGIDLSEAKQQKRFSRPRAGT